MKKYIVKNSFALLEKILIVEGDEIYAEQVRLMYHIYSPKSRKRLGSVSTKLFPQYV